MGGQRSVLVRALRLQLGLTQENIGERSGGRLSRLGVLKVETGKNKATSFDTHTALALGLGLSSDELGELFAEKLSVEAAAARIREREPNLPPPVTTAE